MLELPESTTVAQQLNETIRGKTIRRVIANHSAHKFAFYYGDPSGYDDLLRGRTVGDSTGIGAMVEIAAGNRRVVVGDGAALRFLGDAGKVPEKHQLLLEFEDGSALVCSVQMYGFLLVFAEGDYDDKYYRSAWAKPQPLTAAFDRSYFEGLRTEQTVRLSAKAFLATEQRIPGLGNGVLQDILFHARIHPRRRVETLSESEYDGLFHALRATLADMTAMGGRDTEKDLFGHIGGYQTILSKNTLGTPCPVCGAPVQKAAYLGGAIYWCPVCQLPGE